MLRRIASFGVQATNRALRPLGLVLKRTSAPTRSFAWFFRHIKSLGIEPKYVIDIGVGYGTPAIYEAFPLATYLLIEPVAELRPVLENLKSRLNATYHIAAAGANDGTARINVHRDLTGSSLLRQVEGAALDGEEREIPTVRLASVLPASIPRPAMLKIDTQGNELEVLEGLGPRISDIDLIIVEVSMMEFRSGAPLLNDVVAAMHRRGFVTYDILEGHSRALDGALAQVDFAFVPLASPLRKDRAFFTPGQLDRYLS